MPFLHVKSKKDTLYSFKVHFDLFVVSWCPDLQSVLHGFWVLPHARPALTGPGQVVLTGTLPRVSGTGSDIFQLRNPAWTTVLTIPHSDIQEKFTFWKNSNLSEPSLRGQFQIIYISKREKSMYLVFSGKIIFMMKSVEISKHIQDLIYIKPNFKQSTTFQLCILL